jgi:hypothetical protein
MKTKLLLVISIISTICSYAQVKSMNGNYWAAKEFSKEVALFNAKSFLFQKVLGTNADILKFEITPLAAASSGELTTLLYKCDEKQKDGFVLGFYGDFWNEAGVLYTGYAFKNLEKSQAIEFLNKIQNAIDANNKFLRDAVDNNNICFKYEDIDVLIWVGSYTTIRLFWNGFDSTWENTAFERSKRRFEKKIK